MWFLDVSYKKKIVVVVDNFGFYLYFVLVDHKTVAAMGFISINLFIDVDLVSIIVNFNNFIAFFPIQNIYVLKKLSLFSGFASKMFKCHLNFGFLGQSGILLTSLSA